MIWNRKLLSALVAGVIRLMVLKSSFLFHWAALILFITPALWVLPPENSLLCGAAHKLGEFFGDSFEVGWEALSESPLVMHFTLRIPWQRRGSDACKRILKRSSSPRRGRYDWQLRPRTAFSRHVSLWSRQTKKKRTLRCQQSLSIASPTLSVTEEINLSVNAFSHISFGIKNIQASTSFSSQVKRDKNDTTFKRCFLPMSYT